MPIISASGVDPRSLTSGSVAFEGTPSITVRLSSPDHELSAAVLTTDGRRRYVGEFEQATKHEGVSWSDGALRIAPTSQVAAVVPFVSSEPLSGRIRVTFEIAGRARLVVQPNAQIVKPHVRRWIPMSVRCTGTVTRLASVDRVNGRGVEARPTPMLSANGGVRFDTPGSVGYRA